MLGNAAWRTVLAAFTPETGPDGAGALDTGMSGERGTPEAGGETSVTWLATTTAVERIMGSSAVRSDTVDGPAETGAVPALCAGTGVDDTSAGTAASATGTAISGGVA